jgi:hypothetical protein
MAKAKRERRTSIRTMPADRTIDALEALEQAERKGQQAGPPPPGAAQTEGSTPQEGEEES